MLLLVGKGSWHAYEGILWRWEENKRRERALVASWATLFDDQPTGNGGTSLRRGDLGQGLKAVVEEKGKSHLEYL